ncbi:MAG TPA: hypothetical protein VEB41_16275 [Burkholderiales bacterium]|nr:hypothetical protein [Burkholderiales bacterium]
MAAQILLMRRALALGSVEKGVYRVRGDARINGEPAQAGREIRAGDAITTGPGAELVFVIGRDAYMVRERSSLSFGADVLRVATGAVLSVFGRGAKRIETPTATIGIRGTGVYVESEPQRTYVCTCYGEAELAARDDPASREVVRTRHHEAPRYIMASGAPRMLMEAPVVNHSDAELILLESLVGRQPPFTETDATPYR